MTANLRLLFKLPPAIRQQLLVPQPILGGARTTCCGCPVSSYGLVNGPSSRPLSISTHLFKQGGKQKGIYKNALPQVPKPRARDLPKPQAAATPPPPPPPAAPAFPSSNAPVRPPPPSPKVSAYSHIPNPLFPATDWLSAKFPRQDVILLYVAPSHTAFTIASYAIGFFFIYGAVSYAQLFLKDPPEDSKRPKLPYYVKLMGAWSTVLIAAFGTVFILAPTKLIKSITAVRQRPQQQLKMTAATARQAAWYSTPMPWKLRIEVKRAVPFAKSALLYLKDPQQVSLDRSVPLASQNVALTSYNIGDSKWFTEKYALTGTLEHREGGVFSGATRSMVNIWPGIKREVKRMFMRDQMAYMRIEGSGNFKLDLQNSHMLDGGKILDRMVGTDEDARPGIKSFLFDLMRKK